MHVTSTGVLLSKHMIKEKGNVQLYKDSIFNDWVKTHIIGLLGLEQLHEQN